MSTITAETSKAGNNIKEHVLKYIATFLLGAAIMLVPFYFNTNASIPALKESVQKHNENFEKINKDIQTLIIDGKVSDLKTNDIQRQVIEMKEDIKSMKTDIKLLGETQAKNQQEIIDILKRK